MNFKALLPVCLWCLLPLSVAPVAQWQRQSSSNLMTKSLSDLYGELKLRPQSGGADRKCLKDTSDALMKFQLCADPVASGVKDEDDDEYEDAAADDESGASEEAYEDNHDRYAEEEEQDDGTSADRVSCLIRSLHRSFKAMEDDLNDLAAQLQGHLGAHNQEESGPCGQPDRSDYPTGECERNRKEDQQKDEWKTDLPEDDWQNEPQEVPEKVPDMDPPQQKYDPKEPPNEEDDESSELEFDYGTDVDPDADEESDLCPRLQLSKPQEKAQADQEPT